MTRDEMWKEFENQLKREVHTPMTMSYDDSVRCAELGIEEVVTKWKERLEQKPKTGHWIDTKEMVTDIKGHILHEVVCSECSGISYFRGMGGKCIGANICPNCGAEMESEDEYD